MPYLRLAVSLTYPFRPYLDISLSPPFPPNPGKYGSHPPPLIDWAPEHSFFFSTDVLKCRHLHLSSRVVRLLCWLIGWITEQWKANQLIRCIIKVGLVITEPQQYLLVLTLGTSVVLQSDDQLINLVDQSDSVEAVWEPLNQRTVRIHYQGFSDTLNISNMKVSCKI
jgi:hypothetical protein